jgi:DNA adenine methylase
VYLDPPYYVKGRELYHDFYQPEDHANMAAFVTGSGLAQQWMVSYDNVKEIRRMYATAQHVMYDIGYSARSVRTGSEVMFFADRMKVPPDLGTVKPKSQQQKFDV